MSTTRFVLENLLTGSGVVLQNGSGGAPALIEAAPYTMANLLVHDRYSFWKSSVLAPGTYEVDFTLPALTLISAFGFHGFRLLDGSGSISVDLYSQTGAYSAGGSWTYVETLASAFDTRDSAQELVSPVSADSFRFVFTIGSSSVQFTLGNLLLGTVFDTGMIHSPGGSYSPFRNRIETPLPGGQTVITELGDDGGEWVLPFRSVPNATRTQLMQLAAVAGPFTYVDADGRGFEVFLRNGRLTEARVHTNLWNIDVELVRLP